MYGTTRLQGLISIVIFSVLNPLLKRIKYEFTTNHAQMSTSTLNQLVQGCKHLKRLIIRKATIDVTGEVDFGSNLDYQIEYLSFAYSGHPYISDWKSNPGDFIKIIKAIKGSGLEKSLKKLNILYCEISLTKAKEMLNSDEIGLNHVQIVKEDPSPFGFYN